MWKIIRDFIPELKRHPWWGALFIVALFAEAGFVFLDPYIYGKTIDMFVDVVVLGDGAFGVLLKQVALWFAVYSLWIIFSEIKSFAFYTIMNFNFHYHVSDAFRRLLRKDISVFSQYKSGYLVDLFDRGVEARWGVNNRMINNLVPSLLGFFVIGTAAFFVSWQLTLALLAVIPVQALVSYVGFTVTRPHVKKSHKAWTKTYGIVGDVITNVFATKAYAGEKYEYGRVKRTFQKAMDMQYVSNKKWLFFNMIEIRGLSLFFVLVVGAYLIVTGQTTIGTLMMFRVWGRHIIDPIKQITKQLPAMQTDLAKFELLEELLAKEENIVSSPGSYVKKSDIGHYAIENVSFAHADRVTLKDISFEIEKGEKIALVGPSGAGKSTLAFLLARFYDPMNGSILLDGVDMKEWDYDVLRKHIAVVWQENMLFHETLKFNITYGKRGASQREINRALRDAQIASLVKRHKKGLGAMVGERGIKLSGGEKQRVMIARAMLKNPEIVILDEATSALDSITERDVQKSIDELISDKTAIIIAHRLSTIQHVDRIFVMDAGRIIGQGHHSQLLKTNEMYRKMVHVQADGLVG